MRREENKKNAWQSGEDTEGSAAELEQVPEAVEPRAELQQDNGSPAGQD